MNDPKNSIASRYDLKETKPSYFGAIDAKIVSTENPHVTYAISGPTHQNQPVFEWDLNVFNTSHVGVPAKWNFDWQVFDDQI